jgi:hypothetical protein
MTTRKEMITMDDITAPIGNGPVGPIEPTDNPND